VTTDDTVLREMHPDDVAAVLEAQEPAAVVGLAEVFPQDRFPFPRDVIAERWRTQLRDPAINCFVIQRRRAVVGFGAVREADVPPHAELLTYELRPDIDRNRS
jgi:hypothetical protein